MIWPELCTWFGEKLSLVYEHLAPKLRAELDGTSVSLSVD
jgi:hypothetical protein